VVVYFLLLFFLLHFFVPISKTNLYFGVLLGELRYKFSWGQYLFFSCWSALFKYCLFVENTPGRKVGKVSYEIQIFSNPDRVKGFTTPCAILTGCPQHKTLLKLRSKQKVLIHRNVTCRMNIL